MDNNQEYAVTIANPLRHFVVMCRLSGLFVRVHADGRIHGPNGTIEMFEDGKLRCCARVKSNEVTFAGLAGLAGPPKMIEATQVFEVTDIQMGMAALVNIGLAKLPGPTTYQP